MVETMVEYVSRRMDEEMADLAWIVKSAPRKTGSMGLHELTIELMGWPEERFGYIFAPQLIKKMSNPVLVYEQIITKAVAKYKEVVDTNGPAREESKG